NLIRFPMMVPARVKAEVSDHRTAYQPDRVAQRRNYEQSAAVQPPEWLNVAANRCPELTARFSRSDSGALYRVESRSLPDPAAQKRDQRERSDAQYVHPAPAPSRFRHYQVHQCRRRYAQERDHVKSRDRAAAALVGKLLADHRNRDAEFGGQENLREA